MGESRWLNVEWVDFAEEGLYFAQIVYTPNHVNHKSWIFFARGEKKGKRSQSEENYQSKTKVCSSKKSISRKLEEKYLIERLIGTRKMHVRLYRKSRVLFRRKR